MSDTMTGRCGRSCREKFAFTLIELLVVFVIVSLLMAVVLPSLQQAHQQARKVMCASNLRSIGVAIHSYANDFNDTIPFGPDVLSNFYTVAGDVTSLLSLYDGTPVGLGLLLDGYLAEQPKVLFCPGVDQRSDAEQQLSWVGQKQAQGDYYYRHASVALLSGKPDTLHIRLSNLGRNRNGRSISALAIDVQFLAHPALAGWGIVTRTAHQRKMVNILFAAGQVDSADNSQNQFTIDVGMSPYDALDKILKALERADDLR